MSEYPNEPFDAFDDLEDLDDHEDLEAERLEPVEDDDGPNWHVAIGVLVAAVALGWLVFDGLGSETYFFTVDKAVAKGEKLVGKKIRVKGKVVAGSIVGSKGELGRTFTISEKGKTIRVSYDEALPDTFKEDARVVATGTLGADGTLEAQKVMVKCPSRYEGNPAAEHPDNVPKG